MDHTGIACQIAGLAIALLLTGGCGDESVSAIRPFDHDYTPYAQLLSRHVDSGGWVNYETLSVDSTLLASVVQSFGDVSGDSIRAFTRPQKLAFWVNSYNALTLQSIVQAYPVQSIKDIDGVWDKHTFAVGERRVTLNDIEHEILRKDFADPRIHFAINCASISCPALLDEPYRAAELETQLQASAMRFLIDTLRNEFDPSTRFARISELFSWFGEDFGKLYGTDGPSDQPEALRPALKFIAATLPESLAGFLNETGATVSFLEYDWHLNSHANSADTSTAAE